MHTNDVISEAATLAAEQVRGVGEVGADGVVLTERRLVLTLVDVFFAVHSLETSPKTSMTSE